MAQHSKEPWLLHDRYGEICYKSDEDDQSFGMWCPVDLTSKDNLRRIVACVSALVGWDTATLERYAQGGAPGNPNLGQKFSELNIAREQRDELQVHLANANAALASMAEQRNLLLAALSGLVEDIQGLMTESEGVAGLHLNGDVAPWQELEAGSRFERLSHLPDAVAALFSVEGVIA
ncbi:hypothetical protein [Chromobacterium haemolyticum]|uniref:hypothetical protein n=1 Tax=Chromobacterium haemolyticum TaxID=394935 RepID=UPI000DEEADEC|nr:hypothetical protein [Chromobacterium haemolyticum]